MDVFLTLSLLCIVLSSLMAIIRALVLIVAETAVSVKNG